MKIGIVTFQRAHNHGASLQMYGLYKTLKKLGHDVKVIDYIPDYDTSVQTIKQRIADVLNRKYDKIKAERFKKFREDFFGEDMTAPLEYDQLAAIEDEFDCFIAGSDQIWNFNIGHFDKFYFLDFVKDIDKKYTYAISFNMKGIPMEANEEYIRRLDSFKFFSVREHDGVEAINQLLGRAEDALVHIDPSLLLTGDEWRECVKGVEVPDEKYIAIYTIGKPNELVNEAKELAEQKGLKIYYLSNFYSYLDIKHLRGLGPVEFLAYMANAEYVFTNSFHGTAFSVNFHKKFVTECKTLGKYNFRARSLLKMCGLFERDLSHNKRAVEQIDREDDWDKVEDALNAERARSEQYLKLIESEVENIE